ncbi:DMT family transporter [Mycoplasmatota bacterium zrk1]
MNYIKGVTLIILSSLFFTMNATLVKLLVDIPLYEKVFVRNILGVIFILPIIIKGDVSLFIEKEHRSNLLFRCILGFLGIIAYYYAIDNMILSDAAILNKLNPFFVILFSVLLLKEKLKDYQVISIIFAFLGALFVIKPTFDFSMLPALAALVSAVFAGGAYTAIRSISGKVSPSIIVFYFSLFTSVMTFIILLGNEIVIPDFRQALGLILMGLSATAAQVLMTSAYKYAEASRISIYNYSSIIFALIMTYTFFDDIPDIFSILGGIIIILSGIYNFKNNLRI